MTRVNNLDMSQKNEKSHIDSDSDAEHQSEAIAAAASGGGGTVKSLVPSMLAGFHLSKKNLVGGGDKRKKKAQDEVYQFMRGIMDECTHLKNFSVPIDTELIIAIAALQDAYVPRDDCTHLKDIWPGASIRFLKGGHVSSFVLYLDTFRYFFMTKICSKSIKYIVFSSAGKL